MKIAIKMVNQPTAFVSIILMYCVLWVACSFPMALSCDSCGRECASACGTRHFRTCCFNYLRKRSASPPVAPTPALSPRGLNLEMWLAKTRMEQAERLSRHRPLNDYESMMFGNPVAENELLDYELKDGPSSHREVMNSKRNTVIASHSSHIAGKYRRQRLDDDRDGHDSEQKASEESDPGRLQLLYDV